MGWPIAMNISLKGLLRTQKPTIPFQQFHKLPKTTYQVLVGKFTTLVQTTKDGIPLPCYCRTIKEQVFGSFILLITHSAERILLKNANSVKMLPQVTIPITREGDFKLQKKAIRIIAKLSYRELCRPAFKHLQLLTLPCLYILETVSFCMSKCTLMRGRDVHGYETRGRDNYRSGKQNGGL
ncbi:hypothetical protein J6590_024863 [Homalodisca vitripennis]|nr:hypothetical protein J6590_024863 [Homalodisca vitripennis]